MALALVGCQRGGTPDAASPLNLLLVTLDTVRADALGAYGQPQPSSPAIDRLAQGGVVFEQAVSSAPLTLPAHATLLTGRFPPAHGVRSNSEYVLGAEIPTLAELLKAHGYRTAAEVAAPVLNAQRGLARGFDHYRDLGSADIQRTQVLERGPDGAERRRRLDERPADDITRFGLRFLSEAAAEGAVAAAGGAADAEAEAVQPPAGAGAAPAERPGEPFFLWLHYFDAHLPHVAHEGLAARVGGDPYLAEVLFVDTQIARLVRRLEELGLRERTLVVLVADHGEGRGEHGEAAHGFFVYETTVHVPLVLWGPPALPAGRRVTSLVRSADVAPTLLDLLGLPPLEGVQGRSLLPLLRGEEQEPEPVAYGESVEAALVFGGSPLRFLRRGSWKYVHQLEPLLFQLDEDPGETIDRAAEEPERVARLRAELAELLAGMPAPPGAAPAPPDPAEAERLRALGYLGSGRLEPERLDSLELRGPAPTELTGDIERLAEAGGLLRGGAPERAEPVLREFAARHPHSASIQREYAQALRALGRGQEARRALERALDASPCDAAARVELADLLAELREAEARLLVLRAGVGHCSESHALLNRYAFSLATSPDPALRDGQEALRAARRALELAGDERPALLDTLAAAYAETGNFAEAVSVSRRALAVAEQQGRSPQLVASLRRSLALFERGQPLRVE